MSAEHDLQQLRGALWHTSTRILGTALHPDDCPGCVGLAALSRVGERIDAQQHRISELESLVAKSGNRTPDVRGGTEATLPPFVPLPERYWPKNASDVTFDRAVLREWCAMCLRHPYEAKTEVHAGVVLYLLDAWEATAGVVRSVDDPASKPVTRGPVSGARVTNERQTATSDAGNALWDASLKSASGPVSGAGGNTAGGTGIRTTE